MNKKTPLPVVIYHWLQDLISDLDKALFRHLLKKHGVHNDPSDSGKHVYWMNIVQCIGGREKQKPCEYIFDNPWHARMHEEICKTCQTWEFVTTVKIISPVELTVTDYKKLVEYDEDLREIIREMQYTGDDTAKQEFESDRRALLSKA